mmetsp:Transcript_82925/g.165872  ORF Transcript_82925/g.165872 Transcript_82925/m.165872 type:complete len:208 (+) Transcript_82925:3-626(+)
MLLLLMVVVVVIERSRLNRWRQQHGERGVFELVVRLQVHNGKRHRESEGGGRSTEKLGQGQNGWRPKLGLRFRFVTRTAFLAVATFAALALVLASTFSTPRQPRTQINALEGQVQQLAGVVEGRRRRRGGGGRRREQREGRSKRCCQATDTAATCRLVKSGAVLNDRHPAPVRQLHRKRHELSAAPLALRSCRRLPAQGRKRREQGQ